MSSALIICPKCKNRLNLPPQLEILHEAHKGGGGYVAFGDPDRLLPCPHCGEGLRVKDIIDGKHDMPKSGCLADVAAFGFLGLIFVAVLAYCSRR